MHTTSLLPVSPSMHCSGGCTCPGGVPAQGEPAWDSGYVRGTCIEGVPARGVGGTCRRVYLPKGGTFLGGVPTQGVYLSWGYLPRYPPMNRMRDRCKNITLPQTSFAGLNNMLAHPLREVNPPPLENLGSALYKSWYIHWHVHISDSPAFAVLFLLPPTNEVCEGYDFTPVCQSFCSQGGV